MAEENIPAPNIVVCFRKPDPYVEINGVRKPMADFRDLKVTRQDVEIPNLLEVSMITGLVVRAVISPGLVLEREEPLTNVRISGVLAGDIYCTGWDNRFTVNPDGSFRRKTDPAAPVKATAPAPKTVDKPKQTPVVYPDKPMSAYPKKDEPKKSAPAKNLTAEASGDGVFGLFD